MSYSWQVQDKHQLAKLGAAVQAMNGIQHDTGKDTTLDDVYKWAVFRDRGVGLVPGDVSTKCKHIIQSIAKNNNITDLHGLNEHPNITLNDAFEFMKDVEEKNKDSQSPVVLLHQARPQPQQPRAQPQQPRAQPQQPRAQAKPHGPEPESDNEVEFETIIEATKETLKNAGIKLSPAQLKQFLEINCAKRTETKRVPKAGIKKPRGRPKGSASSSPKQKKPRVNNMTKSKLNKCMNDRELFEICNAHEIETSGTKEDKAASIAKFWKENPDEITKDLTKEMIKNVVVKLLDTDVPNKVGKEELIDMLQNECGF